MRSLESLDLNLINVLHWVLREGSVTAAASRLGLSQPATSRALGRLRDIYGDPLVVQAGRRMVPTPLGVELAPLAARAVTAMRHVAAAGGAFDPLSSEGTFRIAAKDSAAVSLIEIWERDVRPHAPGLALDFIALDPAYLPELTTGECDLAVFMTSPDVHIPSDLRLDELVIRPCRGEEMVTFLRRDHPLAGKALSLEEYVSLDHILINVLRGPTSSVDDWLAEQGLSRRIRYRTQTVLLAKAMLRRTDCALTAVQGLFGSTPDDAWASPAPVPVSACETNVAWHPNWTLNPRHRWVRERLMEGLREPLTALAA